MTPPASVDAAGSGAIGPACEVPEAAAKANVATAIANTVPLMVVLFRANSAIQIMPKHDGGSTTMDARDMNETSKPKLDQSEQCRVTGKGPRIYNE